MGRLLKINETNMLAIDYEDILLHTFLSGKPGNKQDEKLSGSEMENYFTPQMRRAKMLRDENKLWAMNVRLLVNALFKEKSREKRIQVLRSIVNISMKYNCKTNQAYILCVGFSGIPTVETRRTAIKVLQDEVLNLILF